MTSQPTVVWSEIPVTDLNKSMEFYANVFGWTLSVDDTGPNPMANFTSDLNSVAGHLYPGKPAVDGNGPTLHLAVPGTLEDAIDRCTAAGGKVVSPAITIPPGRFAYALDIDGNSLGLFERAKAA